MDTSKVDLLKITMKHLTSGFKDKHLPFKYLGTHSPHSKNTIDKEILAMQI